jgi:hypothetical protein
MEMSVEISNMMDLNIPLNKRIAEVEKRLEEIRIFSGVTDITINARDVFEYALRNITSKTVRIHGVLFRDHELGVAKDSYK